MSGGDGGGGLDGDQGIGRRWGVTLESPLVWARGAGGEGLGLNRTGFGERFFWQEVGGVKLEALPGLDALEVPGHKVRACVRAFMRGILYMRCV